MRFLLLCLLPVVAFGQISFRSPFRELSIYLSLSHQQLTTLSSNQEEFSRWQEPKVTRISQVYEEIGRETAANPLDPDALGVRYAELEAIRREIADRRTKLIQDNQAVLTAAQKPKFQTLEEAVKLQLVIDEAQSASLLLATTCTFSFLSGIESYWLDTNCFVGGVPPPPTASLPPIYFRTFPQLKQYFELSDAQVLALNTNRGDFNDWVQIRYRRLSQIQEEIAKETGASPLRPGALGVRYAEVETIRREIAERQTRRVVDNQALLTAAQKSKYLALEEAVKLQLILLEAPYASLMPGGEDGGLISYCFTGPQTGSVGGVAGGGVRPNPYLP